MEKLYRKNELDFSLVWIGIYLVAQMVADSVSAVLGYQKIMTAPVGLAMVGYLLWWLKKEDLLEAFGLCHFRGNPASFLWFLPLIFIASTNLWNGFQMNVSPGETVLYIVSMFCVGFLEEVIFRGFLFKALAKENVMQAIWICAVTFGIGHIVNLMNGADLVPTILQICYASALGLLFTVIYYKGKSLIPCIITHITINSLSIFAKEGSQAFSIVTCVILTLVSAGYSIWIWKKAE